MQHFTYFASKKAARIATATFLAVTFCLTANAEPFAHDGFESGDFAYSAGGFRWLSPNRTSIVRDDQFVVNNGSPVMIGPVTGRDWENGPGSTGRHALRFRYPAGADWAEQRFSIGSAHPELWASWWLRVPANFYHDGRNNKLFMFWMDEYSDKGDGSTVGMEMRGDSDNPGSATWYLKVSSGRNSVLGGDKGSTSFIRYPSDQGRWMNVVIRFKAESSPDASDGLVQVWRKWETESKFTMTHNLENQPIRIPAAGPKGFSAGYLMGWANTPYKTDTEFLLDDFTLSSTSLIDEFEQTMESPPSPPPSFEVQ